MNFDDTPQEAEFRKQARQWIDANAPKELEAELSRSSLGRIRLQNHDMVEVGKAWQKKKADGGWACLHWPKEYGGRGATPIERVIWQQEEGVYGKLTQPFQIGEGMCGPTVMAYGNEATQTPLFAEARLRRTDLVPVVLRAGRRIGCRGLAHARGEAGRQLDRQRPEDLDLRRALFRLRTSDHPHRSQCAQAQGIDDVLSRHEEQRRRGAPDQAGQRHAGIQRGLFHRCRDSRSSAPRRGRRRLERVADHADERADVDRRAAFDRLSGDVRFLLPT